MVRLITVTILYYQNWIKKITNEKVVLSTKAKSDLIKIARYTQLTWGTTQRNDYLKILDSTFQLLADEPELGINCDYIRGGYRKYPQASHMIY
ncbi:MAG: toxin ParE1/3/4 [Alteromonadaceae bacterium]